jgi:hypothetical protein
MSQVPPAVESSGARAESSRDDERRGNGKKKNKNRNKASQSSVSAFIGKCKDIKEHVYDAIPGRNGFDVFVKTTREIGEYIARSIKDGGEFRVALDPEDLGFTTLTAPVDPPATANAMDIKRWEIKYKAFSEAEERRAKATAQAFAVVLGQCSPTVIDRIKANSLYSAVSDSDDIIGLLRLIRTSMYTGATSKNEMHSLIDTRAKFYAFKQTPRMSNADYLRVFKANVDAIEHLKGDIGTDNAYILQRIIDTGGDVADALIVAASTKAVVREEYLAMHFFLHADARRYGSLIANVQNDYVLGTSKYSKTVNRAYDMLVNYVNPSKLGSSDDQDAGMSFYQEGQPRNKPKKKNDKNGKNNQAQGDDEEEAHVNTDDVAQENTTDVGNTNNSSTNQTAYYDDVSFNIYSTEQIVLLHGLPLRWLLLDSCSATDIFANASLLSGLHIARTPIWVRCNARFSSRNRATLAITPTQCGIT